MGTRSVLPCRIIQPLMQRANQFRALLLLAGRAVLVLIWLVPPGNGNAIAHPDGKQTRIEPGAQQAADPWPIAHAQVEPGLLRQVLDGAADHRYQFIVEMAEQAELPRFAGDLSRQARGSRVVAELQLIAKQTQAGLLAYLARRRAEGHVQEVRPFWVINGLSVTADADTLLEIAARPDVRLIREDRWQQWLDPLSIEETASTLSEGGLEWNITRIQADLAWDVLGLTGSGVTVGIMDTGVDWQHPALQPQYRGYKPGGLSVHEGNWFCATDEGYLYPYDGFGHGTHVTGTAVGGQDADGVAFGVAPGAQWIAAKTLNDDGYGYDSWIHAAFEWIMAPAGDPALAPDVVNGSWGSSIGANEAFRPDLQAVRAAGIVPIFSAGNDGPYPGTVGSPGSYPEAIAVGATDDIDQVTSFSSRGPSPWGEIKPEISAPGAQIRSSLPGGAYGTANGTSMAAPHVTGLVALLLQADSTLSVDAIETILTSSALPLGGQIPNNDTGWGRIDAYKAGAVALQAGYVSGQVTSREDSQSIPFALVTAYDREGQPQGQVAVDQDGHYNLALPTGRYELQAAAFGYLADGVQNVSVVTGGHVTADFSLRVAPAGLLQGQVADADTGAPVGAQVSAKGTPAFTLSDPQTGEYSLALPTGIYTVTVSQNGYRRATAPGVEIAVGETTSLDFALTPAPTLLLLDSGRWYYASQAGFFEAALDDNDYVYDLWEIRDPERDRPDLADLERYNVVVWSSPHDSPAMIRAGDVISGYLKASGNLLLSGQDIGFWDDGLSGFLYHPYYRHLLKAQVLDDNAGREDVIGVSGEILDGLTLPLDGPDSAGNQSAPDLIDVRDPLDASLIGMYENVGGAALRVSGCQSYRAVYLAAGLEGLGDHITRAEVMERALTWLDMPHPAIEVRLSPAHQESVWLGGSAITYTVELQNRGQSADRFDLELSDSAWPVAVMDAVFTQILTESIDLDACETQILGISVSVPPEIGWNVTDVVTLTARSQSDPGVTAQSVFSTKTPAPILLVNDHRWYDTSDRYRTALEDRQLPYDLWRDPQTPTADSDSPTLERLERYPVVIWFTAYDWYKTLTLMEEARLSAYLDGGGRLLLSSQDYLYTSGFTSFATDYLGVLRYTEDYTSTQTVGAVGHPVGNGHAAMDLAYPFPNYSDALRPGPAAQAAFWGQHGQPAALTTRISPWKTAFYAFPLEALNPSDLAWVMGHTVGWLSPLGDSTLAVDSPVIRAGDELTYTLSIRNSGPRPLDSAALYNPVPPSTAFVPGSLQGPATYDSGTQSITWSGRLDPGEAVTVTYRVEADRPLPDGTAIENVAYLSDETGLHLERIVASRVDSPYLGSSVKTVSTEISLPGRMLTYTLSLQNDGLERAEARLVDPIPANSTHLPGSGWASSGLLTSTADLLVWSGTLGVGQAVTVTFPVAISPTIEGYYVYNRASLTDDQGGMTPLEASTLIESRLYLPLILREF